jgi:hypothetical protein
MRLHLSKSLYRSGIRRAFIGGENTRWMVPRHPSPPSKKRRLNSTAGGSGGGTSARSPRSQKRSTSIFCRPVTSCYSWNDWNIDPCRFSRRSTFSFSPVDPGRLETISAAPRRLHPTAATITATRMPPPASQLQLAIALVTAAFVKYPMHRETILRICLSCF